jgi:membrane protein
MALLDNYYRIKQFLEIDLWKVKISTLPRRKAIVYQQLRVWIISFSEFNKDNITEKASSLTYFSLLSIVPVFATLFGIAKGFGLETYLRRELERFFEGQEQILDTSIEFATKMLANTHGGVIVGISFIFILYAVLRLLYNIEMAFNQIWETKSRSWQRKISDYLAIILLSPIFLIFSGTLTVFIQGSIQKMASQIELLGYFKPLILFGLKFVPYVIMWLLLTIFYLIFPNTKVKLWPALLAGILSGTIFQLTQLAWIKGQVYLSSYSTVYGVFAALPLFMIFVQLSWLIVLFGAEYAYSVQNANAWEYKGSVMKMSASHRKRLTILVMYHLIKNFEQRGNHPLSISDLSALVTVPYRFVKDVLNELDDANLVNKISDEDVDLYQPAMDINQIDIHMLLRKLEMNGYNDLKSNSDEKFQEIEELMDEISEETRRSKSNRLLKDL